MRLAIHAIALSVLFAPTLAWAGPPFVTDDPEPTEAGHWEVYGPLIEVEGKGKNYEGAIAAELNYGAAPNVQLTLEIPLSYSHDASGMKWGSGDVAISAKYRFYHNEDAGLSVAAFPGLTLPTANNGMGASKVTAFLPVWVQKNLGFWSIFGGGGYAINSGIGNNDYWTGGVAVSHQVTQKFLLGIEANRQGADTIGGKGSTRLGVATIYHLKAPFRLLASGGPTFEDGGAAAGCHVFLALGMDF